MKVYLEYDMPDTVPEINSLAEFTMKTMMDRNKYKIMWQLRTLENEINESEGIIIINKSGRIHTKNFTRELSDKIMELLKRDEE